MFNCLPQPGVDLIKAEESLSLTAYPDPLTGGKPITNGYGCTFKADLSPWQLGDTITEPEADSLLAHQLETIYLPPLREIPGWPTMNENQRGSLLDFSWNLGAYWFGADGFGTLTRVLRDRRWGDVPAALLLYDNPGTSVEAGLRARRQKEGDLWSSPTPAPAPAYGYPIDMVRAALYYKNLPHQNTAIQWLQDSTGPINQAAFAALYRNNDGDTSPISFINAFKYWSALPHQAAAFKWLQQNTVPAALTEFARLWRITPAVRPEEIRLDVPYFSQRDNYRDYWRTCDSSSSAMCLKFLKPEAIANDDDYLRVVATIGDDTDNSVQERALLTYGVKSQFTTGGDFADLDKSLEAGLPVSIGILHKGSWEDPTGGHWCDVIGKHPSGDYWVNDPWGDLMTSYSNTNGKYCRYPRWALNYRWLDQQPNQGWMRTYYGNE